MNAVYVGTGRPLERILDDRQVVKAEQREPLPQTTVKGDECGFEPEATLAAFTSCLRYTTRFTQTATDLSPAAPCQIELYASDLRFYEAVSDAYRQRAAMPSLKVEMELQSDIGTRKTMSMVGWLADTTKFGTGSAWLSAGFRLVRRISSAMNALDSIRMCIMMNPCRRRVKPIRIPRQRKRLEMASQGHHRKGRIQLENKRKEQIRLDCW